MKHLILKEHTSFCESQTLSKLKALENLAKAKNLESEQDMFGYSIEQSRIHRAYQCCNNRIEHFLFYLNNDFYLISYNECLNKGEHLDFKEYIVKSIIKNKFSNQNYITERGMYYSDLKKIILSGYIFEKQIVEVNYIYSDRERVIKSKKSFIDRIISNDEYESNAKEMQKKLNELFEDDELNYLESQFIKLYNANKVPLYIDESEKIKTTDLLIKLMQNEIKHKSNNQRVVEPCL
jgi:hypothetical protein